MACYHPLRAFDTGYKTENGKPLYKICTSETEYIYKPKNEKVAKSQNIKDIYVDLKITDYIEIPCGKCIGCRLEYSRQWANRCMLEAKESTNNQFITLTYDNEHLPKKRRLNLETGEVGEENNTLYPKHLTKFMKDLREHFRKKGIINIRFFACGEYGEERGRPHYHIITYNLPLEDKKKIRQSQSGFNLYVSDEIDKVWGKGITAIGEVNWETAAYTARYIVKKQKGKEAKNFYLENGQEPEFVRMSRNPGIGKNYYEKNKDTLYETDEMFIPTKNGTLKVKPAKYYDKLYDLEEPEIMAKIKEIRQKNAKNAKEITLSKTSLDNNRYNEILERTKILESRALKRLFEVGKQ